MKITPKKGFVLVSNQEIETQTKTGMIIIPGQEKKRTYLQLESDGEHYKKGDKVLITPYKSKMEIEENLFVIAEEDIMVSFVLDSESNP
jgi:co-chaperonin GroES (HSP10)